MIRLMGVMGGYATSDDHVLLDKVDENSSSLQQGTFLAEQPSSKTTILEL